MKTQARSGLKVGLKYITNKQKFTLEYEGTVSLFEVNAVSPRSHDENTSEDLVLQLQGLKIDPAPQIWIVGWETTVVILSADTLKPSVKVRTVFSPDITTHIRKQNQLTDTDPYTAVGGLDKQISQIRDLIDLPLTRPDLFRHFGSHSLKPTSYSSRPCSFLARSQTAPRGSASRSTWYGKDSPRTRDRVYHELVHHYRQWTRIILSLPWRDGVQVEGSFRRGPCQESLYHRS